MAWHPKLIQANIALYDGAYAEARRLLDEYRTQEGIAREHGALVLWLSAQSQDDPEERLRRLQILVTQGAVDNPYVQMAQQMIADEADHEAKMRAARSTGALPKPSVWTIFAFIVVTAVISLVVITTNSLTPSVDQIMTPIPSIVAVTLAFPDDSQALDPELNSGRYPQGILQVRRFEEASQRVINAGTGARQSPVAGARFYALQIGFECRSGVCDQPPEAILTLQIDADTRITPRSDVLIAGNDALVPVALGRVTVGWVVFEIPIISTVEALIVSAPDNQTFEPIIIALGEPS